MPEKWLFPEDRFFDPEPLQKRTALEIYERVRALPIVSPHGHVDPNLFADPAAGFGDPVEMLVIPDHYVFRVFYSQGLDLADFGIPFRSGSPETVETDHRKIWRLFCENFHLLVGTASYNWLGHEFKFVFGIDEIPDRENADRLYDELVEKSASPEFRPRALMDRFNIETICTTDGAADSLSAHQAIRASGWGDRVRPTFRPDSVMALRSAGFRLEIERLSNASGIEITTFDDFRAALIRRREFFKTMGAVSTDHGVYKPAPKRLPKRKLESIFARAMKGGADKSDEKKFYGHMLMEFAEMSLNDGFVMQLHPGVFRNHNRPIFDRFGADKGCDIPVRTEFTRNLRPLLNEFGNRPNFKLVLFTLDETVYSRELAPLAGHYPALRLGPPWWFNDSWNGINRFFDSVVETAGLYNLSGFIDDTRAFPSIPARHDVFRRALSNWLAKMVVRSFFGIKDAHDLARLLAYDQPKAIYGL